MLEEESSKEDAMPSKAALLKKAALSPLSILSMLPFPGPQKLLLATLSLGPIPKHIAFVMDGNRRWAKTSAHTVQQGHLSGFATLKTVLEVCLNLRGLSTVTVYAFAIDNFKRSEGEVAALMEIAKTRLVELAGHGELIARYSVRVRIVGRKHLLPADVREAVERVENMTRRNTKATLNICMPYASRDEITGSVKICLDNYLRGVEKDALAGTESNTQPITTADLDKGMLLSHSPPLDIMVRTSGVTRLSDFMLWQCTADTRFHFVDKFWPQFGLFDLVPIILDWQRDQWQMSFRKACGWL